MNVKQFERARQNNPFLPLSDIIEELLLQDIISFKLNPGTKISENALSLELNVSRSPVKTALERLAERQFIRIQNSRYYVADFREDEYKEICDFSMMVEPFAASKAAQHITDEQVDTLYALAHKLTRLYSEAYESGKSFGFSKLLKAEIEFHQTVVNCSGNRLIIQMYEDRKYELWRYRGILLYSRPEGFFKTIDTDHVLICDLLKLHDPELAAAVVRRHLHVSKDGIERYELLDMTQKL